MRYQITVGNIGIVKDTDTFNVFLCERGVNHWSVIAKAR